MISDFIRGLLFFLSGFRLMLKPGVRTFTIIPLIINVIIFVLLFIVAKHYLVEFDVWFESLVPAWLRWLSALLWLLFIISFFLIMVFTFTIIANIIAAPFNGFLAERVELHLTGTIGEPRTLLENIADIPRLLARQLAIILYYLPRALILFILFFIPVIQVVAAILWFLFHAWFMTLIYVDYPSDNQRVSIQSVRDSLAKRRVLTLGFGTGVLIAAMIPFINLFMIPAAVAGATALWLHCRRI